MERVLEPISAGSCTNYIQCLSLPTLGGELWKICTSAKLLFHKIWFAVKPILTKIKVSRGITIFHVFFGSLQPAAQGVLGFCTPCLNILLLIWDTCHINFLSISISLPPLHREI